MTISTAAPEDRQAIQGLFDSIFPDGTGRFNRFFFDRVWRPENTLVVFSGGEPVSMLQHWQVSTALGPCSYIYGVATRPDFRGRGLASQLLARVPLPHILIAESPALFHFYRKLGYEVRFFVSRGQGESLGRPMRPEDLPRVLEIYRESRPFLHRSLEHLALCLELYGGRVYEEGGQVCAYSFGNLEAMGTHREKTASRFLFPGSDIPFGCAKGLPGSDPLYINLLYN